MKRWGIAILVLLGIRHVASEESLPSFFELHAQSIDGVDVPFSQFKGKVVMVVNVASRCGFTRQYDQLESLYQKYKERGLVILGFPSNDFGGQEPGSNAEIHGFCNSVYHVTFPLFCKNHVKGDQIQPIYHYLTIKAGAGMGGAVLWNFEKFLINRKGRPVERFRSTTSPDNFKVTEIVERLLDEND